MTAPRTLAVIGGTGFFGKSFLDAFRRGLLAPWNVQRVIAAARRPDVLRAEHPELLCDGVELMTLDVASGGELPRADYLVHAANTSDARRYAADPLAERAAIVGAAARFADRAVLDCPDARIVYTSSGAVYGRQPDDCAGLSEEMALGDAAGLTPYKRDYAEAKREAEACIAALGRAHGLRVAVARCFAFVGTYLPRDQHFAAGNFLGDGMAGRDIGVAARHPVIRSYMHVDDLVRWLMTLADAATPACPVYNVGSGESVEIAELAGAVAARYGVGVRLPARAAAPVDRYVPSVAAAARDLGLTQRDLSATLDDVVRRLGARSLAGSGDSGRAGGANDTGGRC